MVSGKKINGTDIVEIVEHSNKWELTHLEGIEALKVQSINGSAITSAQDLEDKLKVVLNE